MENWTKSENLIGQGKVKEKQKILRNSGKVREKETK